MVKNNQNKNGVKSLKIKPLKTFLEKNSLKFVLVLMVLGLVIRLYNLGFLTLWVDEYMHALAAVNKKFSHGENNGILLTWINTIFSYLFGTSEFALRMPVAILGGLLIFSTYKLALKISNYNIAIIASIFVTFSVFLIFWSRVDRPYGFVATFMVLAYLYFWLFSETFFLKNENNNRFKYLVLMLLFFVLSMLSQLLCFLFVFSIGFYGSLIAIENLIIKQNSLKKMNFFNLVLILNLVLFFLLFTSYGIGITETILSVFLPKNIVEFILPNIKNIKEVLNSENWNKCYNTYIGVINTDYKVVNYLGWLGFILSFFINRKLGYFLFSSFIVPFLLLSFVFISTSHAKYLIQIYPFFLISAAVSVYFIGFKFLPFFNKKYINNLSYINFLNFVFLVFVFIIFPKKEISNLINPKKHGNIVDSKLAEINFVNWKTPCLFLKERKKDGDIVMATVKPAPQYYLNLDSVIWFRQMHLNPKWSLNSKDEEKYVKNLPDNRPNSAYTYEQLVKTYQNNKRGWLLADYYFDNALTDPQAKRFVEQNMVYHFDACEDGAVKVFSWDKDQPKPYNSAFVIELGKNPNQYASFPLSINLNQTILTPKVNVYITAQGIDSNNEAYLVLNEKGDKAVPIKTNGKANQIGYFIAEVDASLFVNGENKIQFVYNETEGNGDYQTGFVVYNLEIR